MTKDLSKLPIRTAPRSSTINPRDIFKSLTLRGDIENIWEPQAEGLGLWHEKYRQEPDVVIQMNTGGGKTLVGLLIAQSIVNETKGKVLYVCPTNQLVEQVAQKASGCGIAVSAYMKGRWFDEAVYARSTGPCITNYWAVFNGKSIFKSQDVQGIIFDDAHVASSFVRSNFTLKIPSSQGAFKPIADLFRTYFSKNSQVQELEDALSGDWRALLFVPTFEIRDKSDQLRRILVEHGVVSQKETTFSWVYLKDKLNRCAALISGSGIEISPPILPVRDLPYFQNNVRRIYLTATMPSSVEFIRTFGVAGCPKIIPGGKSGDAQRQFLLLQGETDDERREQALALVDRMKACIIAPSDEAAAEWVPPASKYDGSTGQGGIDAFGNSTAPDKLVLAARYDGIDLPGDACRVLVLSGLPTGSSLIDRFTDQTLRIERLRSAHVATRITQAIGRIFRSNTDHGAVIIASIEVERWLSDPQNQRYLPELLQKQIQLGIELRRMVDEGHATFEQLLTAVLEGRKDWDKLYASNVEAFATQAKAGEEDWLVDLASRERDAFEKLWNSNYGQAATIYRSIAEEADAHDKRLAAWYRHWEGLAHSLAGDADSASYAYIAAVSVRSELGRPSLKSARIVPQDEKEPSAQALRVSRLLSQKKAAVAKKLKEVKSGLKYGPQTNQLEQALCDLGKLIGMEASRPEEEFRTGPDVLWRSPEHKAGVAIEAKSNKKPTSRYQKKEDIGQFYDHMAWLQKKYPEEDFYKVIAGRKLAVSVDANPPADLRIITIEQYQSVAEHFEELLTFIESTAPMPADLPVYIERGLQHFGLLWPNCIESLESALATDLTQASPPAENDA